MNHLFPKVYRKLNETGIDSSLNEIGSVELP
jgi:hypothetical protein